MQRSLLIQTTESAWVFECIQGGRRVEASRPPFLWGLPRPSITGDDVTERIVNVLRCPPPKDEEPWLLKQWAPSCSDPFTATTFLDKPLQPYQARQAW